ncbi:MAG TPA: valine--tRNA ligase [Candidatus Nitrosocosmicus sp.]|nr:valine--tRNA ligase [Candidatus Nitrosocosmicus sp.]
MDTKFIPGQHESKLYQFWEEKKYFEAKVSPNKKPFCIILPPPNANGELHLGHAMFVYEDILIRFHKLKGEETFWLLGLDHAGIETQFVFEKHLQKQGKSRFDYDRDTLYQMIWDFVMANKGTIKGQLKRLGFALDWSKEKFTLDPQIVKIVHQTFKNLYDQNLVYRAKKLVNYCTRCGTSYSDYEVNYEEENGNLYYIKYGPFEVATTRPETIFGDTGVAVHPNDKRYSEWIGKEVQIEGPIGPFSVKVIADQIVDPKFGTGVVKVTPAHDFNDYEMGMRHNLEMKQVIDFSGRLNELTGTYQGLKVTEARGKVVEELENKKLMTKIKKDYSHRVGKCYKCSRVIEPLPKEQWFIKVKPLSDKSVELIQSDSIQLYPKKYKQQAISLLHNYIDWNISRQNVWGIRIPAYKCKSADKWFVSTETPRNCLICNQKDFIQDEDIFDTWFSSSQWPFATLQTIGKDYYDYFYPTSVMETGHDILRAWVARMIMIGQFETQKIPFRNVFLHGMVRDKQGQKMSKSKGNVINPIKMVDTYGADAFRASLIFGTKEGGDVALSDAKVIGMRNFANKIWNIGRFIFLSSKSQVSTEIPDQVRNDNVSGHKEVDKILKDLRKEFTSLKKNYLKQMDTYKFSSALGDVYEFIWHRYADIYIEQLKDSIRSGNIKASEELREVYLETLVMLHPFMPFVTEAVWKVFNGEEASILQEKL